MPNRLDPPPASTREPLCSPATGILLCVLVPAFALGLPGRAAAQDTFGASDFLDLTSTPSPVTINAEQCADDMPITVSWTLDADPIDQEIVVTTHTEDDCRAGLVTEVDERVATRQGSVELGAQDVLPECPDVDGEERYICVRIQPTTAGDDGIAWLVEAFVDTVAPEPPDELSAKPADSALQIEWSWDARPEDLRTVHVFYRQADEEAEPREQSATGAATSARITDLQNDVEYEVWVVAEDQVGNVGEESDSVLATPQPTVGFWELYRQQGGAETGGCSGAGAGGGSLPAALLAGLGLFVLASIRHRGALLTAAGLALVVMAWPGEPAAAEEREPTRWFTELDFGPYLPEIDAEFDQGGPYGEIFGARGRLMARLRAERALWQGVGQLGLGASLSFARASGEALFADGTPSPDPANFNFLPFQLSLTYRFDYPVDQWRVPLVPYARAGLQATTWWVTGPDGVEVDADGNRAAGIRTGYFYGGGLKFLLNVIDPRLASDFRRSTGVQRTYLYVDVTRMEVDGFGSSGFILSDTTWFAGLSFEL